MGRSGRLDQGEAERWHLRLVTSTERRSTAWRNEAIVPGFCGAVGGIKVGHGTGSHNTICHFSQLEIKRRRKGRSLLTANA